MSEKEWKYSKNLGETIVKYLQCCYPIYDYLPNLPTAGDYNKVLSNIPRDTLWEAIKTWCSYEECIPTPDIIYRVWEVDEYIRKGKHVL